MAQEAVEPLVFHCAPLSTPYFAFAYSCLQASCIMIFDFLSDLEFSAMFDKIN